MIESINGTGLSGITGKSGKQAKNGLFAKLMAMLQKQNQNQSKGMFTATQSEALIGNKGQQLLKLSRNTLIEKNNDGLEGQVAATQFIIDKPLLANKVTNKGEVRLSVANPLIANKVTGEGEQQLFAVTKPLLANKLPGKDEQQLLASNNAPLLSNRVTGKGGQQLLNNDSAPLLSNQMSKGEQQLLSGGKSPLSNQLHKGEQVAFSLDTAEASQQTNKSGLAAPLNKAMHHAGKTETHVAGGINVATATQSGETNGVRNTTASVEIARNITSAAATSEGEIKVIADDKPSQGAAAAIVASHNTKHVQQQVNHNTVQSGVSAVTVQGSSIETAMGDSGSQSSDKGTQDGRLISNLGGELKSSSSSSTGNTQFHNYMTSKTTPTLSPFDSMQHIAQSASNGQTKLEIQLDPAHLGKIQITLQTDASKQIQVHMVVDQGATRAVIDQQLPALRAALAQQGFDLSGFSMGSNSQNGSGDANEQQGTGSSLANSGEQNSLESGVTNTTQQQIAKAAGSSLSIHI